MGVVKGLMVGRIVLSILLVLSCLILSASATPLVKVEVSNSTYYESFTVLNPEDGNRIEMVGGEERLPVIKLIYNGINSVEYTKDSLTINITTYGIDEYTDYPVGYEFSKHIYYEEAVNAKVHGEVGIAGETAYIYLISTYPTAIKDALSSAVDGDTAPLRDLLDNPVDNKTITLTGTGVNMAQFGTLPPGDYVVVATLNESSSQNITLISTTAFMVLEHRSNLLNVPGTVTRESVNEGYVSGEFKIIGGSADATYTCIAALIKKDEDFDLRLESNGTKAGTNLKLNDAKLVDSFKVGGVGLKNVNADIVYDWINEAFSTVSVGKWSGEDTSEFSLPVIGMPDGEYYLYVAAWNSTNSSQRVVAFSDKKVKIKTVGEEDGKVIIKGGRATPPPKPGETLVSSDPTGKVTSSVTASSPDGKASVTIPAGTIANDAEGNPLTKVEVSTPSILPAPVPSGADFVGYACNFGPEGATFNPAVEISIEFDPADFPEGTTPVIYTYEDGEWKALETTIVDNKAIAMLDHFSVFALFAAVAVAPTPTPTPTVTPTVPPVTPTPTPTPPPFPPIPMVVVIIAIVAVAIIVSVGYLLLKKKK